MFRVPKDIALKMVKINYFLQKSFINFYKPQFKTGRTKSRKKRKNAKNCKIVGSKTPQKDLLTLKYGLPSSLTT